MCRVTETATSDLVLFALLLGADCSVERQTVVREGSLPTGKVVGCVTVALQAPLGCQQTFDTDRSTL